MDSDPDLTIVLLGSSGVGKSASGNTILGRPTFESRWSFTPVTREISAATATVLGKKISVIDTPGIFDAEEQIKAWCERHLQSSRPCLFLVVFRVGRFTIEQYKVLEAAQRAAGPQRFNNIYLLFTGGDALEEKSLEEFVFEHEESLSFANFFSRRSHLFDNVNGGQEQIRDLLLKSGHIETTQQPAAVPKDRRIVLLGLPGAGKSSCGNTILGSEKFKRGCDFNLVSTEAVSESAVVEGCQVTVVDTPGFTDEVLTPEQLFEEIMKFLVIASPGPHAFVIVVRIGRINENSPDIRLSELLPRLFDEKASKYSMVLFTHGDELEGRSMDDLIQSNTHVKQLVNMCAGRYCVFDNKTRKRREQVRNFLNQVDEMVTANGGEHYSNDMFREAVTLIAEQKTGEQTGRETDRQTDDKTNKSARSCQSGSSASSGGSSTESSGLSGFLRRWWRS